MVLDDAGVFALFGLQRQSRTGFVIQRWCIPAARGVVEDTYLVVEVTERARSALRVFGTRPPEHELLPRGDSFYHD